MTMFSRLVRPIASKSVRAFHTSPPNKVFRNSFGRWISEEVKEVAPKPNKIPWKSPIGKEITPVHKTCYDDAATKQEMLDRLATYIYEIEVDMESQFKKQQKSIVRQRRTLWAFIIVDLGSSCWLGYLFADGVVEPAPRPRAQITIPVQVTIQWGSGSTASSKNAQEKGLFSSQPNAQEYGAKNGKL
jgi:hypothetical protein